MNKNELETMRRLAEAVADGAAVDWEREVKPRSSSERPYRGLRVIETLREAHRSVDGESSSTSGGRASAPRPNVLRWGHLVVHEELGHGGYGTVFRAFDERLDHDVALKLLRPGVYPADTALEEFLSEGRKLAAVRHPNVLVVHGADRHDNRVGIWTELVQGKTLEEILELQGPFGPEEATAVGIDLCRALASVHAADLVHRDVKTSNIMRETGGRIVLMDFSSVVELTLPDKDDIATPISGTPTYMAPELLRGEQATVSSDVYSLGVVLYRLVSCRLPIEANNYAELFEKHERGRLTPLRDVRADLPAGFVSVVERALASDPEARFPSTGEMERALNALRGTGSEGPAPAPRTRRPWARPLAAIAVSLLALAAVAWIVSTLIPSAELQVEVSLFRLTAETEQRLMPGSTIAPGEQLFLEIEGTNRMWVYVFNEDDYGLQYAMFPRDDLDLANPLPANAKHRLPGPRGGQQLYWDVTTAGGEEIFVVVASVEPLESLEQILSRLSAAQPGPVTDVTDSEIPARLRSIDGASPRKQPGPRRETIAEVAGALSSVASTRSGLCFWQIRLRNPR